MTPWTTIRVYVSLPFDFLALAAAWMSGFIIGGLWVARCNVDTYMMARRAFVQAMAEVVAEKAAKS